MSGQKLPLKMQVEYMSFSAHADYRQISGEHSKFELKPSTI
jgi:Cft2 family RNA processing exonuclease